MVESVLDEVPGLGETRRSALIARFGSMKRLRAATVDEVGQVPGIGPRTAAAVVETMARHRPRAAVNTATGEIIDGEAAASTTGEGER
jgi:excinuclease ABC subunit C